jgi:hypothetical protein
MGSVEVPHFMNAVRKTTAVILAAAMGAALGLVQLTVAKLADITTLGADFGGGNDRIQTAVFRRRAPHTAHAVDPSSSD